MFNLRKFLLSNGPRDAAGRNDGAWRVELRPVRVDGQHNLHAIHWQPDGSHTSQLLVTDLTQSQMQTALTDAVQALERLFDREVERAS